MGPPRFELESMALPRGDIKGFLSTFYIVTLPEATRIPSYPTGPKTRKVEKSRDIK